MGRALSPVHSWIREFQLYNSMTKERRSSYLKSQAKLEYMLVVFQLNILAASAILVHMLLLMSFLEKVNLCLYGFPGEQWEVNLPAEEVPPELPEPALVSCTEPFVNTPPGAFSGCVCPMQVGLRFKVSLITFFPLATELVEQVAFGVFMQQSQVRIMGANVDGQQLDKIVVHIDLAPFGENFYNATAHFTYEQFWKKRVFLKTSIFEDREVLYVDYPGSAKER